MSKLFKNLKKFNNKIALIDLDEKKYSYKEILKVANQIDSKIENQSLIVMIADNNTESIMGYISFIRSNNITILLDKSFKIEYIQKIINKYKPNYLFGPPEYIEKLTSIDLSNINSLLSDHEVQSKSRLLGDIDSNISTNEIINGKNVTIKGSR